MRFIGALETLLDPIVAVLDALPAHFDPDFAPRDVLDLMAAWLGVDLDESQELKHQREMVRRSAELGRQRGTVKRARAGARALLPGRAAARRGPGWGHVDARSGQGGQGSAAAVVRRLLRQAGGRERAGGDRPLIEKWKPVHTTYRLRVKAPKSKAEKKKDES